MGRNASHFKAGHIVWNYWLKKRRLLMAQAGIQGIVGMAIRKWKPNREWLMLGIVLGNLLPDADNLVLAVVTVTGLATEGLHRTFTHSLFTVIAIAFYIGARATTCPLWGSLGLGIGVLVHILLDLLIWFNGVALLWPIPLWVSL
jgi:hypothetical protein